MLKDSIEIITNDGLCYFAELFTTIMLGQNSATKLQLGIHCFGLIDKFDHVIGSDQGEFTSRLHWNEYRIGCSQCICSQERERRRRIQNDDIKNRVSGKSCG